MYKIGFAAHPAVKNEALKLSDKLTSMEHSNQVIELVHDHDISDIEFYFNVLKNGIAEIVCLNLPAIESGLPEDIVIAALSERSDCFEKLVYTPQAGNDNPHIKLGSDARVAVFNKRAEAIAHELFPDWTLEVLEIQDLNKKLFENFDGVIASCERLDESDIDATAYSTFKFHPKEFIPHPGQNVIAFLCKNDDKELRKIMAKIHVTEVSQATNIERTIDQGLSEKGWSGIGVYCLVDHNYHYHVYASGISSENNLFKRARYSTATSENIAKNVFELLSTID